MFFNQSPLIPLTLWPFLWVANLYYLCTDVDQPWRKGWCIARVKCSVCLRSIQKPLWKPHHVQQFDGTCCSSFSHFFSSNYMSVLIFFTPKHLQLVLKRLSLCTQQHCTPEDLSFLFVLGGCFHDLGQKVAHPNIFVLTMIHALVQNLRPKNWGLRLMKQYSNTAQGGAYMLWY